MRHGSLFSGIGGFDLAAQWLGWENVFHCEWNSFGQRVLKHYWPNADSHHDITKTNFTQYANRIDILTGGFPCQPYSSAGKRKGKEDERHLWPEMLRTIREVAPRYVVGENVLGLTNWDGGIVFDEVHSDLELAGYEVAAVVIPAAAVNAPHGRDRVWFVARRVDAGNADNDQRPPVGGVSQGSDTESNGVRDATNASYNKHGLQTEGGLDVDGSLLGGRERKQKTNGSYFVGSNEPIANADGDGFNQRNGGNEVNPSQGGFDALGDAHASDGDGNATDANRERPSIRKLKTKIPRHVVATNSSGVTTDAGGERQKRRDGQIVGQVPTTHGIEKFSVPTKWETFPTQPPVCSGNDGLPDQLDGITFSKWRHESLKAYGNAIVPQVAFEIFKVIQKIENGETL
jgi:DNA (cytosine-5)-methyltransferase 1